MVSIALKTHSIMIVDDQPIVHEGLISLLEKEDALSVTATAESADKTLEILKTITPDLIIAGLWLNDSDGFFLIHKIRQKYPSIRILVYSMFKEELYGARAASIGASGYIMKSQKISSVKNAIYTVLKGECFFSVAVKKQLQEKGCCSESHLEKLSNRELEVFTLVGQGLNTHQIGKKLDISRNTVDTHRINIRKKLRLPTGKALDLCAFKIVTRENLLLAPSRSEALVL